MKDKVNIFWFRRDLRLEDNHGLYRALAADLPVLPVFIFDKAILDDLEDRSDARVTFIYDAILQLQTQLQEIGKRLWVFHGTPREVFQQLLADHAVQYVITNRDYEPYANARDNAIRELLEAHGAALSTFKDQVVFEKSEVVKADGAPYTVFTPYSRKWREQFTQRHIKLFPSEQLLQHFYNGQAPHIPSLEAIGFKRSNTAKPSPKIKNDLLQRYKAERDYPAKQSTSRLGVHLRFGTISIRQLVAQTLDHSETFLNELIWREFYMQILHHFPHVVSNAFKPAYDHIPWRQDEAEFERWCEGKTGYPLVDAGMRQLNATGYMHNRVRMVVASFLTKHLLLDWRWGEAYFAAKLLDFELASNNGGWQWAAGTGCDAAPYFRVFNPTTQLMKFDPELVYVKQWVPEYGTVAYPIPMVEHTFARQRALDTYKHALAWKHPMAHS